MKKSALVLLVLLAISLTHSVCAAGVLVPGNSAPSPIAPGTPYTMAPGAVPDAVKSNSNQTPQATMTATPTVPLAPIPRQEPPTNLGNTNGSQAVGGYTSSPQVSYISPTQQQAMIETEKQNLAVLQKAMADIGQINVNESVDPKNAEGQVERIQAQTANASGINSISQKLVAAQKRLAILQSGPLPVTDFAMLYRIQ